MSKINLQFFRVTLEGISRGNRLLRRVILIKIKKQMQSNYRVCLSTIRENIFKRIILLNSWKKRNCSNEIPMNVRVLLHNKMLRLPLGLKYDNE